MEVALVGEGDAGSWTDANAAHGILPEAAGLPATELGLVLLPWR